MAKRFAGLASAILLGFALTAFTGSALAGNGNGNGAGNAATPAAPAAEPASQGSPPASPGNSASAPGQVKKTSTSTTSASGGGSAIQTSTAGMKPSNATVQSKDTYAAAGSNKTKLYGNGQTAGQIAMQSGASSSAMLHGPGNSQPHKMALCPGGHEVDVHALKAKGHQKQCAATTTSGGTTKTHTPTVQTPTTQVTATQVTSHAAATSVTGAAVNVTPTATGSAATSTPATQQGGVLGATASQSGKPEGGVLGAIEAVGHGTLPFTGFPLWIAAIAAAALIAAGLVLRQHARAIV